MVYWTPGVMPKLSGRLEGAIGEKGSRPCGKVVTSACAAMLDAATIERPVLLPLRNSWNACMNVSGTLAAAFTCTKR